MNLEEHTKILEFDRIDGVYVLESESGSREFGTKEELVSYIKTLKGKLKVEDFYSNSIIYLTDGQCVFHESEWGFEDKENNRIWCGIGPDNPYDDGMGRLSVYDVYSERELL